MPEFTAPELIGHDLRRVVRSRESDCFLLAVLVYHLLLFDHPFQGKWRQRSEVPPISESVKLGISVFDKSGRMSFPEVQMPIERLWPPLAEMFRDCFTAGCHDPAKRPTADQWSHVLAEASLMLSTCSRETKHFVLEHWKDCYWCGLRQKGLDLYPSSSTPHPAVPPFGKRVEHSLRVGDDVWIAEQWKSSSAAKRVLSKHSKVRAIRAAVDRVKTLSDWRHSVDQCPHDFWLPLTLWPKSLDGTPLTQRERFRGRSIAEYIAKLRQLRREVDTATPLIAKWRHQRDVEHREQSAPRIIAKFGSICSVLPKEAPEAAALSACHAEAKEFHGRLTSMKEVLNKALQLYDLGEYDEAREGLDSLGAEWETYPLLTAARAQLDAFRLPWDRPELRARIRQAIAAEDYSTAESGLALLPEVALRSERELVRRRRQKFESVIESAYSVLEAGNAHSDDADRVVDSLRETMFSSGRELILARLAFARRLNPPPQIAEVRRTPSVKRRTPTAAASVSAVRSEAIRRDVADRHELDEVEKVGIPVVAWVTMVLFVISCTAAAVIAFIR